MAYFGPSGGRLFIICINNDLDRRPLTVNETVPSKGELIPELLQIVNVPGGSGRKENLNYGLGRCPTEKD